MEIATPALFLWHTSAPGWNNAFINFNQNGWFPAPNYVVLKLWRDHFLPNRISMEGETKHLNIAATASDDKKQVCVKIVNPTERPVTMKIKGGAMLGIPVWKVIHASGLTESNSMEFPDRIKVKEQEVTMLGNDLIVLVPAYSASVLSMKHE